MLFIIESFLDFVLLISAKGIASFDSFIQSNQTKAFGYKNNQHGEIEQIDAAEFAQNSASCCFYKDGLLKQTANAYVSHFNYIKISNLATIKFCKSLEMCT